ncbi:importin beta/transportin, putative [Theileria annulata]|uniref:Importin beta/transportin, putative n=1 Tax=Theileria annulata TaxID=5874 RepID=Q4UA87_THEAN|nr:importin beta/transportin, putative [Theileria annulata]CAI76266.1 importin beta/transportin, putative [Theileria annulata]|eukprot:XP_952890.1 importin beta/transportin, putative [Theileria annulata]
MPLDRALYSQLLEILTLSEKGDTETQKYVHESLASFQNNRADVPLYYLEASLSGPTFHTKQMALLLLKNSVLQNWNKTDPAIQSVIKNEIINIVNLREVKLRNAVASCYVSIFNVQGYDQWPTGLYNLLSIISNSASTVGSEEVDEVVETAVVTLVMILEDTISNGAMTPNYLNYLKSDFIVKLFQITSKSPALTEITSRILLTLLDSNVILEYLVSDLFGQFWNLLGVMATLDNYNVKKCVLKAMHNLWDLVPMSILQSSDALFPFISKLCSDDAYTIQIDALDFYTHILQSQLYTSSNNQIRCLLLGKMANEFGTLLKTLVDNTKYSSWDYMSMDRTHLEDDNANIPDDMQDVPIKTREDEETNTWGNTWTVRKGSALLLDTISQLYAQSNPEVIKILLSYIQEKLDSTDWELKESGVLTLGAISKGSLYTLYPYLPKVIDYLIVVATDPKPLLRIISCWCLSRFVEWMFLPNNTNTYLSKTLSVILRGMLDRNKRVQESACSSFTSFEECGTTLLLPYAGQILHVILSCIELYQSRNFMILYDVIGTLYQSLGESITQQAEHNQLIDVLLNRLEIVGLGDVQYIGLIECLSSIISVLGSKLPQFFVQKITKHCVSSLCELVGDITELEYFYQSVQVLTDTISILLTSTQGSVNCNEACNVINGLRISNGIDLVIVINELCSSKISVILQSCIALMGDLSNSSIQLNQDSLKVLVDNVQNYINNIQSCPNPNEQSSINSSSTNVQSRLNSINSREESDEYYGVVNNCVWVFGVLCDNQLGIYNSSNIDLVFLLVVKVINLCSNNFCILQNCCVTLGKFSNHFPNVAIKYLNSFLNPLCKHLIHSKNDKEKFNTTLSISNLILLHLQSNNTQSVNSLGNVIKIGKEELETCNVLLLFKLYISCTKGTLDNFGDSFGTNSDLIQVCVNLIKSLLYQHPKLVQLIDPDTKNQLNSLTSLT